MEQLYEWIRNITYYLIFITVVINLLPNKKYDKYLRFFSGMVLILLVVKPLTGSLRLDDKIAYYFESITFKKEAAELSGELSKMETARLETVIAQYEAAVKTDLSSMAETEGFACRYITAVIDSNEESRSFGYVTSISMAVTDRRGDENGEVSIENPIIPIEGVTEVEIPEIQAEETQADEIQAGKTQPEDKKAERNRQQEENSRLAGLRRRIAEYYDLEEQDIEIQLENG